MLIKELPDQVREQLKARAAAHRRSMENEALVILEEALSDRAGGRALGEVIPTPLKGRRPLTDEMLSEALHTDRR